MISRPQEIEEELDLIFEKYRAEQPDITFGEYLKKNASTEFIVWKKRVDEILERERHS